MLLLLHTAQQPLSSRHKLRSHSFSYANQGPNPANYGEKAIRRLRKEIYLSVQVITYEVNQTEATRRRENAAHSYRPLSGAAVELPPYNNPAAGPASRRTAPLPAAASHCPGRAPARDRMNRT